MFLKRADRSSSAIGSRILGAKSWSITARLAAFYTLTTALLLLATMCVLYWLVIRQMNGEDREFLIDKLRAITADLRDETDAQALLKREVHLGQHERRAPYFVRILNEQGQMLAERPPFGKWLPPEAFADPPDSQSARTEAIDFETAEGKLFLVMASRAQIGREAGRPCILQIAQDRTDDQTFKRAFRLLLPMVLLCGVGASAGTALVVARRGLRPLREMAAATARIQASQLNERVGGKKWPQELAPLARAFDQMLHRLETSFRQLSQFSADLAHELRTPIFNLRGEAEVALTKSRSAPEYREVIESSLEEFNRLSRMIESLLFLARAERSETRIESRLLDVRREVESIIEFCEAEAQERSIEIECLGHALANVDSILFRRALTNLLSNALQYTPTGGKVTISIDEREVGVVEVCVGDTGPGIAHEHLGKIFDRFYRVDDSRHASQGTGLGLAIVKSIMDLHGGSVSVESDLGKGTNVSLRFPRCNGSQPG